MGEQFVTSWSVGWSSDLLVPEYNAVELPTEQTMVQSMQQCEPESPRTRWPHRGDIWHFPEFAKDVLCGMVANRVAEDAVQQKHKAMVAEAAVACDDSFMDDCQIGMERNQIGDFAAVPGALAPETEQDTKALMKAFFAKMLYKCKLCQHYDPATGQGCRKGADCGFAHGEHELRNATLQKALVRNALPCLGGDRCLRIKPKKGDADCPFWHKEDNVPLNPNRLSMPTVCPSSLPERRWVAS